MFTLWKIPSSDTISDKSRSFSEPIVLGVCFGSKVMILVNHEIRALMVSLPCGHFCRPFDANGLLLMAGV